jgi:hypothetical protein
MPLLCPLYSRGQRVRLDCPADLWHHGQWGVVKKWNGPLVPCGVRDGLPVPGDWDWFSYAVELDGGKVVSGVGESKLRLNAKGA